MYTPGTQRRDPENPGDPWQLPLEKKIKHCLGNTCNNVVCKCHAAETALVVTIVATVTLAIEFGYMNSMCFFVIFLIFYFLYFSCFF